MVFIPCKDGISHNEIESTTPEHITAGCNVLLPAMLQNNWNLTPILPNSSWNQNSFNIRFLALVANLGADPASQGTILLSEVYP